MAESSSGLEPGGARPSLRWPHRVAWCLGIVVFPLIWVGGLVTTTDAGMAVPDWPNTYGYNMLAYPLYDWFFGPWDLFVEHGHRLLGTLAGMVSILLVTVTVCSTRDRGLRWFAWILLLMVICQGALGGARVLLDDRDFARLHGCIGPLYFASIAAFGVMTGRWWQDRHRREALEGQPSRLGRMGMLLGVASYLQLVLGAFVRHLPESTLPGEFSALVWSHLTGAGLIAAGTGVVLLVSRAARYRGSGLRGPVLLAAVLVGCQIGLGLATWVVKYGWPAWMDRWSWAAAWVIPEKSFWQVNIVTLHVAVGSLILVAWVVVALRGYRLASPGSGGDDGAAG